MVIDGTGYTKDVIIFPDGSILSPWWRNQGHVLATDDLQKLLETEPEIIICGTGAMGVMRPSKSLEKYLEANNIDFIAILRLRSWMLAFGRDYRMTSRARGYP